MTHVMVTGATGFIGQWLCTDLTANGHTVHAMIRRPDQLEPLRATCEHRGGRGSSIRAVHGDLDAPGLGLQTDPEVEIIFHLGARFAWNLSFEEARRTNVQGGNAVVDLAARTGARLVIVGGFMSQNPAYLRELGIDPRKPEQADWRRVYARSGAYEASKLESFFTMSGRAEARGVPWIGVHPAALCGHSVSGALADGQPFADLIDSIRLGEMVAVPGGPAHWLPLVTVDHLTALMAALVDNPWPAHKALIGLDPTTPDFASLVAEIAAALGISAPRRRVPLPVIRAMLRLPGMEQLTRTSRESLAFLRTERLDLGPTVAFATASDIQTPDIRAAIARTAHHRDGEPVTP